MRRRAPPAAALGALALPVDALSLQPAQQLHLLGRQLLVVLVGMPGSGKSTFAEELISQHPECWRRISQDVLGSRQRCIQRAKAALKQTRGDVQLAAALLGKIEQLVDMGFERPKVAAALIKAKGDLDAAIQAPHSGQAGWRHPGPGAPS